MRRFAFALVALLALPHGAWAAETNLVLADWRDGAFAAGLPAPVEGANAVRIPLATDACPRRVLLDVLYEPEEAGVTLEGVGGAAVLFELRAELWKDGARVTERPIRMPGYSHPLGLTSGDGSYEVLLWLRTGAAVDWSARVRGWAQPGVAACLDPVLVAEVEADPAGPDDAGTEWVELLNPNERPVDVSGWVVSSGFASAMVPANTVLAPGARLVVAFDLADALDGTNASVRLADGLGLVRHETPALVDEADDGRSWHLDASGAWAFADATPGA